MALVDHPYFQQAMQRFRRKRFELFRGLLARVPRPLTIIDLGGTQDFWTRTDLVNESDLHITTLNTTPEPAGGPNLRAVVGDARSMPEFGDQQFDIVFSNSAIEHVGTFADQRRMANEVMRIGKRYFIQTPNRHFPMEPHFLFLGFQYLPFDTRVWLVQHFRMGHVPRMPEREHAAAAVSGTELLSQAQLCVLFPDAIVAEERLLGLVKSYICHSGF